MKNITMATKYNLLDTSELNKDFSLYRQGRTDYLLTRELPVILEKHDRSKRILDYGCGAGLSTRFLKSLGLNVVGVDISKAIPWLINSLFFLDDIEKNLYLIQRYLINYT